MRLLFCLFCLFFFQIKITAQVINIESKRFLQDTNGFIGKADLNFNINQNISQVISLGVNIHSQYVHNKHRILAIGDLAFIKAGKQDFVNSGYQHFRYNYKLSHILTWEAFVQAQYNRILLLDRRYLAGTGPRFKLIKQPNFRAYTAVLYMYEYQSQNNDSIEAYNNRISSYLTLSLSSKKVEFTSTTFYQPNLANFNDFRIANDTAFEIIITGHFNFKVGFNLLYDTKQPIGIPDLTYILKNGLSYKF
jgi:putative salt-induced outer membrane protein YdiY